MHKENKKEKKKLVLPFSFTPSLVRVSAFTILVALVPLYVANDDDDANMHVMSTTTAQLELHIMLCLVRIYLCVRTVFCRKLLAALALALALALPSSPVTSFSTLLYNNSKLRAVDDDNQVSHCNVRCHAYLHRTLSQRNRPALCSSRANASEGRIDRAA